MLELIKKWFELKFHVHDWETVEEKLKKCLKMTIKVAQLKLKKFIYSVVKYVIK